MSISDPQIERFMKAIRTALVGPPEMSQRDLSAELGITIGSLSKYLRGEVHPEKVGFGVQSELARVLGHSIDTLHRYYETGLWESDLSLEDITGWLQSSAGVEDFPAVMQSLATASARAAQGVQPVKESSPWLWPLTVIKEAGIKDSMRKKMGLTDERLRALATEGTYDDDLVEAFSIAADYEEPAVREAFSKREPIV